MTGDSSPELGRGLSVDSESYDCSHACVNEDARQHQKSGSAAAAFAAAAIKSLEAQLVEAHSVAAAAVAGDLRTELMQMTRAESPIMKSTTS